MHKADLLRKLGVLVIEDFLAISDCNKICDEMRSGNKSNAATYSTVKDRVSVDDRLRKTLYCEISSKSHHRITKKIKSTKPMLESFFNTRLADTFEQPKYLLYRRGGFFSPHTDDQLHRKVNVTVNLNNKLSGEGIAEYVGGELQLYGLLKGDEFSNRGIAAPSNAGCLIAYPVDIVHEVTPVVNGSRFAIVSRFLNRH